METAIKLAERLIAGVIKPSPASEQDGLASKPGKALAGKGLPSPDVVFCTRDEQPLAHDVGL